MMKYLFRNWDFDLNVEFQFGLAFGFNVISEDRHYYYNFHFLIAFIDFVFIYREKKLDLNNLEYTIKNRQVKPLTSKENSYKINQTTAYVTERKKARK